jgi:D-tagatose-1,6-bisphosphate aldolase subunit GatZ/KbaZ
LPVPVYVIGTEVPTPGGATHSLDHISPTSASAALKTIDTHRRVFTEEGLADAFERAIALVVQPGVEFGHESVVQYNPAAARQLAHVLDTEPQFVFEAHSTDYQAPGNLSQLVSDGFAILKVGPALTFALREALYGLDCIAAELDADYGQRPLKAAMETLMVSEPGFWQGHYPGPSAEQAVLRHYSLSDRIRYYWPHPYVQVAVQRLTDTLRDRVIPQTLLSQFLPLDLAHEGSATADSLIEAAITRVLDDYAAACRSA